MGDFFLNKILYKMKTIFIKPNDQKTVYGETLEFTACEPPFWLGIAGAYCRNNGLDITLLDAEAENISFESLESRINEINPDIVGIFVLGTNLSASTQKMNGAEITCRIIKECNPSTKIFLWGLHPSALPERTLTECQADYIIKGEGFYTISRLIKNDFKNIDELNDIYYKSKNGEFIFTGSGGLLETDDLPMPAWELLPMDKYMPHNWHIMGEENPNSTRGRYGVISTSIGCPFNCSFCAISAQFGTKKVRFWKIDRVMSEIDRLVKEYNVKYIKILDECFVLKKDYVNEFCDKLISRNYDLNIWAYARIDTTSQELLKKLYQAGIKWLAYGIESGDDSVLSGVDKEQFTTNQTIQVMKWSKEANINVVANFMFGLPDDNYKTMHSTLNFAKLINAEWPNFYVTMPYPGSKDYFEYIKDGRIKNDSWIQYAQYSYECTPMGSKYLTPAEVLKFRDEAFIDFFKNNKEYEKLIENKFGKQYVDLIRKMTSRKLKRKILGD